MITDAHSHVLALDFGGTKLAAAVVDIQNGQILAQQRQATPAEQGADGSIKTMLTLGRQVLKDCTLAAPARVGISFGGPVSGDCRTVLMSNHVPGWENVPLPQLVSETFGCPAAMDNDANAAALGSWWYDAHREPDHMVYIQISTGIGAGLVLKREIYRGAAIAGEIGHITVVPNGPLCVCGKHGCLESLTAGWAIARAGRKALENAVHGSPLWQACQGDADRLDARLVIQAANAGDPTAGEIINDAFSALGIAIANMILLYDPQTVMLGGGVARAQREMLAVMEPVIERELHPLSKKRCKLQFSGLEGRETLLGAAHLPL
ncbi:MAG: ROK family protein [Anaerolineae bacterium]|nr:ROK family protein [Anaerolineae bacterium]